MNSKQDGKLTLEMLEEAVKRGAEEGHNHPCLRGHRIITCVHPAYKVYNAVCTVCFELFKLDKK